MSNNPVGIDYWMFKTLMRQTDILYKTLVGCSLQTVSRSLYLYFNWHIFKGMTCWLYLLFYSLYLLPSNKMLSLRACELVLCLIYVLVIHWSNCQQGCRKSKGESPGCTWGQYFIILSTLLSTANSTCWFDQIFLKQKVSIFSLICGTVTFLLHSYSTVWKSKS